MISGKWMVWSCVKIKEETWQKKLVETTISVCLSVCVCVCEAFQCEALSIHNVSRNVQSYYIICLQCSLSFCEQAEEMLENIFSIFKTKLNHLDWGDNNSQQSLMKKVNWHQNKSSVSWNLNLQVKMFPFLCRSTRSHQDSGLKLRAKENLNLTYFFQR